MAKQVSTNARQQISSPLGGRGPANSGNLDNAIEAEDLTKYYGEVLAVDHISFGVRPGEIFGFLGPNGAGKTTTQRMLTTLLEPTEGRILVNGQDIAHNAYSVKRQMGLVPEESNVYDELNAWDNLMFTARLYQVPRSEREERAGNLLETFGLWEKRVVKVAEYSKGMRRRLSIAMGILHQPALLFLDEPTTGLDAQSTRMIRNLIRQLNAEGTTVFLTTHQIEEANQLCDRVAIINHGQIAAIDTPEQLKQAFRRVQSVEVALEPEVREPHLSSGKHGQLNDGQMHAQALADLPGVTSSIKVGDKWRLYTEDPSGLLPQLMDYAGSQKLRVVNLSTLGPSLEDVFLEITGQQVGTMQHKVHRNVRRRRGRKGDGR
jgi:ABC-2 type transport system ATP-binding protein